MYHSGIKGCFRVVPGGKSLGKREEPDMYSHERDYFTILIWGRVFTKIISPICRYFRVLRNISYGEEKGLEILHI